jgi:DNA-binding transcriptional LysR family regulator
MNLLASMRYLVALAEHRHFGRAAAACHVTQPALSNALRALEKDFGCAIVQRGRAYAGLTPEGERVLAAAQRMLREHELLQQDLQSRIGRPCGHLRLGVVPTAVPVAARFAAMLQARHDGIAPVVRSLSSQEIEAGLAELTLDLGLGFADRARARGAALELLPQYEERFYLVRRAAEPSPRLRIGAPMAWAEAARLPLCLLTPEMHNRSIVDAAFAKAGCAAVRPVIETDSVLTLVLVAQAGEVCSVLPGALVAGVRSQGALEAWPLALPEVVTPMAFMTLARAEPSRVLAAALALAGEAAWLREAAACTGALAGAAGDS